MEVGKNFVAGGGWEEWEEWEEWEGWEGWAPLGGVGMGKVPRGRS
jgi:hypothetical protein